MNDTQLEIPEGLAISPAVTVEQPSDTCGAVDAFEGALAAAQADWEKLHPEPTPQERAELEAYMKAEADATYGGTAQSAYQIGADAMEEARSLSVAFENGVGDEAAAYMRYAAGERVVIEAAPGKSVEAQVIVSAVPNSLSAAAIDVVAARNSSVNLSIVVDSPDGAAAG
ncbi:MAG: hypothetical protein E7Z99_04925, partial [Coriobacteriaceae bacterium]|nr:hypothetical protein [Coriobacteriaceae bacterium]